jgi:predicted esterase
MTLFLRQEFADAYDLLTAEGPLHPGHEIDVYYLRSCLAARQGRYELAVGLIEEAFERGHWYGEALFRLTPSWQVLQGRPEFEQVAAANIAKQRAVQVSASHRTVTPHHRTPPYRSLVALHGNGADGDSALEGWRAAVDDGWLLTAIQSSQIISPNRFIWDDTPLALREIRQQYGALETEFELSADHLIIAGFSMGADTALRVALTATIPARAFILLGPGGPDTDDPHTWLPLIQQQRAGGTPLRGYLLIGEQDDVATAETQRQLAQLLTAHGIPCGFEVLPGLAHEYPPDFSEILRRALAFVDPATRRP